MCIGKAVKRVNSLESTLYVHYGASAIGSIKLIFIVVHSILKFKSAYDEFFNEKTKYFLF